MVDDPFSSPSGGSGSRPPAVGRSPQMVWGARRWGLQRRASVSVKLEPPSSLRGTSPTTSFGGREWPSRPATNTFRWGSCCRPRGQGSQGVQSFEMRASTAVALGLLTLASGCAHPAGSPTPFDLEVAQTGLIHHEGFGGMVHCNRTRDLSCRRITAASDRFQCRYREWAKSDSWPLKTAVIAREGDTWRWVSGDHPQCSVMSIQ
jgi:hypothetical protein